MDINKLCPHCMREVLNGEVCPHCGHDIKAEQELDYQLRPFTILNGKYLVGDEWVKEVPGLPILAWISR